MIMQPSGSNFELAQLIYQKVGDRRFRCAEIEPEYPMLRSFLQKLCIAGILMKHRFVHRNRVNEYQLTDQAVERITRQLNKQEL
jgi:hypothetical protein